MNDRLVNYKQGAIIISLLDAINIGLHASINKNTFLDISEYVNNRYFNFVSSDLVLENTPFITEDGSIVYGSIPIYNDLYIELNDNDTYNFNSKSGYYNNCYIYCNSATPNFTDTIVFTNKGFNQPVVLGPNVSNMHRMFYGMDSFNQPLDIPGSVIDVSYVLASSYYYNSPITLHDGIVNAAYMLQCCYYYDLPISIPSSIENASYMLANTKFSHSIVIPNNATDISGMLFNTNFNQDIYIPSSVINSASLLAYCKLFNKNVICEGAPLDISGLFYSSGFNGTFEIPYGVQRLDGLFSATSFNSSFNIPNSVNAINYFIAYANYFNQPININQPLEYVARFVDSCNSFNSDVYINGSAIGQIGNRDKTLIMNCNSFNANIALDGGNFNILGNLVANTYGFNHLNISNVYANTLTNVAYGEYNYTEYNRYQYLGNICMCNSNFYYITNAFVAYNTHYNVNRNYNRISICIEDTYINMLYNLFYNVQFNYSLGAKVYFNNVRVDWMNCAFYQNESFTASIYFDSNTYINRFIGLIKSKSGCYGSIIFNENTVIGDNYISGLIQPISTYSSPTINMNVTLPNTIASVYALFNGAHRTEININIPDSVIHMDRAFYNCNLYELNASFGNSIQTMNYAFYNNPWFNRTVTIPDTVYAIDNIFGNCVRLNSDIYLPNRSDLIASNAFYNCNNFNANIYAPQGIDTTGWSQNAIDHIVWY